MRRISVCVCLMGLACSSEAPAPILNDADPAVVVQGTAARVVVSGVFEFDNLTTDFKTGEIRFNTAGRIDVNGMGVAATSADCGNVNCVEIQLPSTLVVGPVDVRLFDRHGQDVTNGNILKIDPAEDVQGRLQVALFQDGQPVDGTVAPGQQLTVQATLIDASGGAATGFMGKAQLTVQPVGIDQESDFVNGVARFTVDNVACDLGPSLAVTASDGAMRYREEVMISVAGGELALAVSTLPPFTPGPCQVANSVTVIDSCGNAARNPPQRIEARISAALGSAGSVYLDTECTVDVLDMSTGSFELRVDVPEPDTYSIAISGDGALLGTVALAVLPGPVQITWGDQDLEVDAGECKTLDATVTDGNDNPVAGFELAGPIPGRTNFGTQCPYDGNPPVTDADGKMTIGMESFSDGFFTFHPDGATNNPLKFTVSALEAVRVEFPDTLTAGQCAQIQPLFFDTYDNMVPAEPMRIAVSNPRTSILATGLSTNPNCMDVLDGNDTIAANQNLYARWNWAPELRLQPTINGVTSVTSILVNPAAASRLDLTGPKKLDAYVCDGFSVRSVDPFGNPAMSQQAVVLNVETVASQPVAAGSFGVTPDVAACANPAPAASIALTRPGSFSGKSMPMANGTFDIVATTAGLTPTRHRVRVQPLCGNGRIDGIEECDPGPNADPMCNASCQRVLQTVLCAGEPSRCFAAATTITISDNCANVTTPCRGTFTGPAPTGAFIVHARSNSTFFPISLNATTGANYSIVFEPGAGVIGEAGLLVTQGSADITVYGGIWTSPMNGGDIIEIRDNSRVTLHNVRIGPGDHHAIHTNQNGILAYYGGEVFNNSGGGVVLNSAVAARMVNVITWGNGSFGGIDLQRDVNNVLAFLTIVDGIDCRGGGTKDIYTSIVHPNRVLTNDRCVPRLSLANFAAGMTVPPGSINTSIPGWDPFTFRLKGNSPCIDFVSPGVLPNLGMLPIDIDVDQDPRPVGTGYDCGADEF